MSEATPPKGIEAWKVWSKQQIHSAFFLIEPDVCNTYRFDEELGVYLGFAGKEVIKQLENVTWDDEAQAPADKTKQQVYISMVRGPQRIQPHCVPFAPDLEALRIINNLRLPDDIVDSLTQAVKFGVGNDVEDFGSALSFDSPASDTGYGSDRFHHRFHYYETPWNERRSQGTPALSNRHDDYGFLVKIYYEGDTEERSENWPKDAPRLEEMGKEE
ncbi:hypothetical protein CDEST_14599 [Colletotrichum destructivum]|uniref:Uncharacterized protein n=1 Tax=Colletotrichum destructivum TaxID=34406 RepID=A0AAX4J2M7_9PEZI|nr:hypothetical protein CDEST_14599 [Colletotrichum destructivum]